MTLLRAGDEVQWASHGGGGSTRKRGRIVRVVPAGSAIDALKAELRETHDLSPVMLCGGPRPGISYLVEVPRERRKPRLYWPRVDALEPCADRILPPVASHPHRARQAPLFSVAPVRRLVDGTCLTTTPTPVTIEVVTYCAGKWIFVDTETGQAFVHDGRRFKVVDEQERARALQALDARPVTVRGHHLRRRPLRTPKTNGEP